MTSRVVELRQYTLHPGRRDALVHLFDGHLVETQEAAGIEVIGQFRDLDDPDRFVWLRGFPDLATRHRALARFYGGPGWAQHRDAANATMARFDDVLLLRPLSPATGVPESGQARPAVGASTAPRSVVTATVYLLAAPMTSVVLHLVEAVLEPELTRRGVPHHGLLVTEPGPNTFSPLPVREGEHVIVRLARFEDDEAHAAVRADLQAAPAWRAAQARLSSHLLRPVQELRLRPTERSMLR